MNKYEICEKVFVYYKIVANTEAEAWEKLDKVKVPYKNSENIFVDVLECDIIEIQEA